MAKAQRAVTLCGPPLRPIGPSARSRRRVPRASLAAPASPWAIEFWAYGPNRVQRQPDVNPAQTPGVWHVPESAKGVLDVRSRPNTPIAKPLGLPPGRLKWVAAAAAQAPAESRTDFDSLNASLPKGEQRDRLGNSPGTVVGRSAGASAKASTPATRPFCYGFR